MQRAAAVLPGQSVVVLFNATPHAQLMVKTIPTSDHLNCVDGLTAKQPRRSKSLLSGGLLSSLYLDTEAIAFLERE